MTLEEIQNFKGKYPKQLWYLFLIEMWERFTFYGMRALLGLYISHLILSANYQQADPVTMAENIAKYEEKHEGEKITEGHPQYFIITSQQKEKDAAEAVAAKRYGIINAFIYMMAFIGGLFADKLFGFRRSIFWGGILMAIGTFIMAVPGSFSFYLGVSILIVGTGFFKPNISTMVGALYKDGDPRRDAGFSLFYSGINIGAFLSGLTIAFIGTAYSWSLGFSLAGICMLLGLGLFIFTQKSLGPIGLAPDPEKLSKPVAGIPRGWLFHLGTLLFIPLFFALVYYPMEFNMTGLFGTVKNIHVADGDAAQFKGSLMQDDLAVSGANIYLYDEEKNLLQTATSDATGSFQLTGINTEVAQYIVTDDTCAANKIVYAGEKNATKELTIIPGESSYILENYMVQLVDLIFLIAAIITIAFLFFEVRKATKEESKKLIAAVILIFFSVIFWSFFEQGGGSLNFFALGNVDSHGLNMTSVNNSVNALWVIIFAPLVGLLWLALAKRNKEPNTVVKFGLGFVFLGAGFLVFYLSRFLQHLKDSHHLLCSVLLIWF
ncbi:MAG: MFS transporter [Crocinitomicaceae bacterium]|nr:MFS transporter [Crocinitomicaceae bacterium]